MFGDGRSFWFNNVDDPGLANLASKNKISLQQIQLVRY